MTDQDMSIKLDSVQAEIATRRVQLRELRLTYDIAKNRLSHVERQLKKLEEQYELLAQGQLPLDYNLDWPVL